MREGERKVERVNTKAELVCQVIIGGGSYCDAHRTVTLMSQTAARQDWSGRRHCRY